MTAWLLTGAGVLAAVLVVGGYRLSVRRYRQAPEPPHEQDAGICFYLHEKHVMNLYLQGNYEALKQEVEERTRFDTQASVSAQLGGIHGKAGREAEKEMIAKYIKDVGAITVIGRIVDEMERKANIVYVNLFDGSLEPGPGLDRALRSARRAARLSDLSSFVFVSVVGQFRVTDRTDETVALSAPYGSSGQVSVTCMRGQLLEDVPTIPFSARCLGRIQGWDPSSSKLVIDPVLAIYR